MFQSRASNLVASDTNGWTDVFVRDLAAQCTLLVSLRADGNGAGNRVSVAGAMGSDGRTVVIESYAADLVPGDRNEAKDIFLLRLNAGDLDQDGLPDDWEAAGFGDLALGAEDDPDGDGLTNREEHLAGTSPVDGGSVLRVLTLTSLASGQTTVLWSAVPGRTYRVEYKEDLSTVGWVSLEGEWTANGEQAAAVDPGSAEPARHRFYRVVLVR
jgi:hypothetical protein